MSGVFISYRRTDSRAAAGRIYERLSSTYPEPTFRDRESIPPGARFKDAIRQEIHKCDVVLILIGPRWESILMERERAGTFDYVAFEVAEALRAGKYCVPVLVDGPDEGDNASGKTAELPATLPPSLSGLLELNAFHVREASFEPDVDRLQAHIEPHVRDLRTRARRIVRRLSVPALLLASVAVAIVAALGVTLWPEPPATMGPGGLDIAVAGWDVATEADGLDSEQLGRELGRTITGAIGATQPGGAGQLESLDELWGPSKVGVVEGDTAFDRERAARHRGEELLADVVVYGRAEDAGDGTFEVELSFVFTGDDERRTTDPTAIEQTYVAAKRLDLERLRPDQVERVLPEVALLTTMVDGLRFLDNDEVGEAITSFELLSDPSQREGQRYVGHVLLGLAFSRQAEIGDTVANLTRAQSHYEMAAALSPNRTTAEVGALGVRYLVAIDSQDYGELALVRNDYEDLLARNPGLVTSVLAETMIGQIAHALAVADVGEEARDQRATDDLLDEAAQHFTTAVTLYEEASDDAKNEIKLITSGAHAGLALVAVERSEFERAADSYRTAQQLSSPFWRAEYRADRGIVLYLDGRPCEAIDELDQAVLALSERATYDQERVATLAALQERAQSECE